jgi:hypothetical protein
MQIVEDLAILNSISQPTKVQLQQHKKQAIKFGEYSNLLFPEDQWFNYQYYQVAVVPHLIDNP